MVNKHPRRVLGIGLNRSDYESEQYINRRTEAYHKTTGRYPSKDEVVSILKREKNGRLKPADKKWSKRAFEYRTISRFLVDELSRLIMLSDDEDPIRVIYRFMNDMDDVSAKGDHHSVWGPASMMRDAAEDILDLI